MGAWEKPRLSDSIFKASAIKTIYLRMLREKRSKTIALEEYFFALKQERGLTFSQVGSTLSKPCRWPFAWKGRENSRILSRPGERFRAKNSP
jgi:hypothetical protein